MKEYLTKSINDELVKNKDNLNSQAEVNKLVKDTYTKEARFIKESNEWLNPI